ncbi:hypothetical protein A946_09685 [Methylacidiphilum kamchatkense Kam1]|uniref:HNH/ENDO VII superfamily nuclease n=1 Tax=Methylacidiphilum kamchatkense Kam1 TaxID=1202785 RepID=A0A0C1RIP8_9BACT|nr:hypothetical protein [Methylacidiphilum kamchatkense]KIE57922.1 hypothetical protein A946_09685 [Methylacidiphilum kamchatkense Kam1]QDQ42350.1 hypothetical protein kam1_1120 [Methylacidiphilum kamchatkense Kam1]
MPEEQSWKPVRVKRIHPKEVKEKEAEFENKVKKEYLKTLATRHRNLLEQLGIPNKEIDKMKLGKVPDGWTVDHSIPTFLSGFLKDPNAWDNFVLMRKEIHDFKNKHIDDVYERVLRTLGYKYQGYPEDGVGQELGYPQLIHQVIGYSYNKDNGLFYPMATANEVGNTEQKILEPKNYSKEQVGQHVAEVEKNYELKDKAKPLKKSKFFGWIGTALTLLGIGEEAKAAVREGKETGHWAQSFGKALSRVGLPLMGSSLGGSAGAIFGSVLFPGIGTMAGGVVGMGVGGFFGSIASERVEEFMDRLSSPAPTFNHEYVRASASATREDQQVALQKEKQREKPEEKERPTGRAFGLEKDSGQKADAAKEEKEAKGLASQSRQGLSVAECLAKIQQEIGLASYHGNVELKDPEKSIEKIQKEKRPTPFLFSPPPQQQSIENRSKER